MNNVYNDVQMTKEVPRTSVLRDEELSISDATLIARLRGVWRYKDLHLCPEAADRIEELVERNKELALQLLSTQGQAAEAEDKLAKAIDLLHRHCDTWGMNDFDVTTLAELKGESHE